MATEVIDPSQLTALRQLTAAAITAAAATPFAGAPQPPPLPGVALYCNPIAGSALWSYTAQGHLPLPVAAVAPFLWQGAQRLAWDATYESVEDIVPSYAGTAPSEHAKLVRLAVKPVLVVASRDFAMLQMRTCEDGGTTVASVGVSVEDARVPEVEGCVRGAVLPGSAWVLAQGSSAAGAAYCTLTYTIATDVRGWVPALAVNAAVGSTLGRYFSGLAQACGCQLGIPA